MSGFPPNFDKWTKGLQKAWLSGNRAALARSATLADCPYEDKRKADGRLTWSRAYINAWRDGFKDFRKNYPNWPED